MPKSFNKGEWSEFYTFLKILVDRKIHAADKNLERIEDRFYPILKVVKEENSICKIYDLSKKDTINIYCINQGKQEFFSISPAPITDFIKKIFDSIKNTKGASFSIPGLESIMEYVQCESIKSGSRKKADIKLIIRDNITLEENEVDFSIKSNIGSNPTLLNASGATNFVYKIDGLKPNWKEINNIEGVRKVRDRVNAITDRNGKITFAKMNSKVFEKNLRKIDTLMPIILSEFLLCFFKGEGTNLKELTAKIMNSETIKNFCPYFNYDDISFKIRHLLLNIALGMVPQSTWDGLLKANGGYIVVKRGGEIVCYHIYNISQLGEYLFDNTKLETPSTSRHNFATIFEEDEELRIKLNLQIRFT